MQRANQLITSSLCLSFKKMDQQIDGRFPFMVVDFNRLQCVTAVA
jgi:hypothetical protein